MGSRGEVELYLSKTGRNRKERRKKEAREGYRMTRWVGSKETKRYGYDDGMLLNRTGSHVT